MEPQTKMQILERLVKDGSISLEEAFLLHESEKVFVPTYPAITPNDNWQTPWTPFQPSVQPFIGGSDTVKISMSGSPISWSVPNGGSFLFTKTTLNT